MENVEAGEWHTHAGRRQRHASEVDTVTDLTERGAIRTQIATKMRFESGVMRGLRRLVGDGRVGVGTGHSGTDSLITES